MKKIQFSAEALFLVVLVFCITTVSFLTIDAEAKDYDVVILNGRVMDPETNLDAVRNVGIKDGKIATITEDEIAGKETIDAKGHVVAPGFIDTHVHIIDQPFGQKLMLRDGVTTPLDLEVGAYPVDRFYDYMEGKSQTNYGATVSTLGIREKVFNPKYNSKTGIVTTDIFAKDESAFIDMKWSATVPSKEQIKKINEMVDEGLERGALGIGVPVGYMIAGVTSAEITGWQKLAAKYGRAVFLHGRFSSQEPPTTGILGFEELMSNASVYGGGLMLQHMHQQALGESIDALKMVDDARESGMSIIAEIYPYNFGATIVGADYLKPDNYGPNMGRSYKDIIEISTLKPLTKDRYDELVKSNPGTAVMFYGAKEEDMLNALAYPGTTVGSDAFPMTVSKTGAMAVDWDLAYEDVQGHPRAAGTHSIVLRMVREKNLMPLMTAISKMSYLPAKFLEENGVKQMAHKGRIQEGADSDITIFDPKTVTDNSTMKQGALPATGIPYVLVNGTIVVKDSKVLEDVFPGKPIRAEQTN
ncbi:MAG: amidohydrolase family protein [Thermodesulfobacteriota bacterium]